MSRLSKRMTWKPRPAISSQSPSLQPSSWEPSPLTSRTAGSDRSPRTSYSSSSSPTFALGTRGAGPLPVAEVRDVGGGGDRGRRPVADGGGDLLGQLGANVADRPEALDRGRHVRLGQDVARLVVVDVDLEDVRVG